MKLTAGIQRTLYIVSDYLLTNAALLLFNCYRYDTIARYEGYYSASNYLCSHTIVMEQVFVPLICMVVYWLSGYYNKPMRKSRFQELATTFTTAFVNSFMILLVILINDLGMVKSVNYALLLTAFALFFFLPYAGRYLITLNALVKAKRGLIRYPAVIVGASQKATTTAEKLKARSHSPGFEVKAYVPLEGENIDCSLKDSIISLDEAMAMVHRGEISEFIIVTEKADDRRAMDLLYKLIGLRVPVKIAPDDLSYVASGIRLHDIFDEPFLDLSTPGMTESGKNIKRALDIAASGVALTVLALPMAVIALIVKATSKGPAFYTQERIGRLNKPFKICKFRSMRVDAEKNGPSLSSRNDNRITPFGRIMRKYRLDELPQFWNVLKGDMSLVGPRPERAFFIEKISDTAPWYPMLLQVRPGITSWGIVKKGYCSTVEEMATRSRYDLVYVAQMSLTVDFKILVHTIKTVITGKGM